MHPTPILEDQVSMFMLVRKRMAQLNFKASGFFFVVFYNLQYDGGYILTSLHPG
jgi:type IV secretory pathway VirB6-like protein